MPQSQHEIVKLKSLLFREGILQVTLFSRRVLCPAVLQFSYVASNEKDWTCSS